MPSQDLLGKKSLNLNSEQNLSKNASVTPVIPPEHLSEFYSFMSNSSTVPSSPGREYSGASFEQIQSINREPSLNTFTSFSPSVSDLANILTSKDFENTTEKYENIIQKAESLRESLASVCVAASEFGQALEDSITECPKVNNSRNVSNGIMNAGGLQHIIAANQNILSGLILLSFEKPLKKELTRLREEYNSNHKAYLQEVKTKSKLLREKELENLKLSKSKTRNLNMYKNNLMSLTNQIDDIDRLKYEYYNDINSMIENFNRDQLLIRTGALVRAQLEIAESIAKKGWSGGGLDELLEISPDIFGTDYTDDEDENIEIEVHTKDDTEVADGQISSNGASSADGKSTLGKNDTDHTIEQSNETQPVSVMGEQKPLKSYKGSHNSEDNEHDSKVESSSLIYKDAGESSMDESFSLPAVNQSNSAFNQSTRISDVNNRNDGTNIDNKNILNELDN